MDFDLSALSKGRVYHLMIQAIVPRPVAWVLSDSGEGRFNLAPFSYFNGICSDPPLLMISVGRKGDGSPKDTWRNIEERQDFVLHIASSDMADAVTETSAPLEHGECEIDRAGLSTVPFEGSRLPRMLGPKVALACRRHTILEMGEGPQGVIFGEVHHAWIDEAIVSENGGRWSVDPMRLDPLARLGGDFYGKLGAVTEVPRPRGG